MMGIISDDEFARQLDELENGKSIPEPEVRPAVVVDINRGRGHTNETPESLRKIIGETALEGASVHSISEAFQISPSSISAYKAGATSTASYHKPDQELVKHTNNVRSKIADKATKRIMLALKEITPERVKDAKLKDISALAKDMSAVVKNIEPQTATQINAPTYMIYAPRVRKEDEFEVVEAINE
jgi:hypothetical protein